MSVLRHRLWWTAVLVVIGLGGAGLASAVDRPHGIEHRPEISWRADTAAEPWLAAMHAELEAQEERVAELATAGRRVLVGVYTTELAAVDEALADGASVSEELQAALVPVLELRSRPPGGIETWRLSDSARDRLGRLDDALASAAGLQAAWSELATDGRRAAQLVDALSTHDQHVLEAGDAADAGRWGDALARLELAGEQLDQAEDARRLLAPDAAVPAFDELVPRYRAYDQTLAAFYAHVEQAGTTDSPEAVELRAQVDAALVVLPTEALTLRTIMIQAAGPVLAERLVVIEDARGAIGDALEVTP